MDKIILILLIITIIESIVIMIMLKNSNTSSELKKELETQNSRLRQELNSSANENLRSISDVVSRSQNDISHAQITQLNTINQHLMEKQQTVIDMTAKMSSQLEQRFQSFAVESEQKLENIRRSVENKLALKWFSEAVERHEDYGNALGGCAIAYTLLHDFEKGEDFYRKAILNHVPDSQGFTSYYKEIQAASLLENKSATSSQKGE